MRLRRRLARPAVRLLRHRCRQRVQQLAHRHAVEVHTRRQRSSQWGRCKVVLQSCLVSSSLMQVRRLQLLAHAKPASRGVGRRGRAAFTAR